MSEFASQNVPNPAPQPDSEGQRITRLLRMAQEIRREPRQTQEALYQKLGVGRSQYYKDKAALAEVGFRFDFHKARGRMLEQSPDTIAYPVTEEEEINEFLDAVAEAMPLSDEQKTALYDVYQGPRNENTGERFYRGLPIGSEFHPHGLYPSVSSEAMLSYQFIQLCSLHLIFTHKGGNHRILIL